MSIHYGVGGNPGPCRVSVDHIIPDGKPQLITIIREAPPFTLHTVKVSFLFINIGSCAETGMKTSSVVDCVMNSNALIQ